MLSCITLSIFAAPWDFPKKMADVTHPFGKSFSDPYVQSYGAFIIGTQGYPNYKLNVQVSFDQSVPVPYYAVIGVWGTWDGTSYAWRKDFTYLFNTGQWHKSVDYPLKSYEEIYTEVTELLDYGPQ